MASGSGDPLAAARRLQPRVQERPMHDANAAVIDLEKGLPRYRYVLVNEGS